MAVFSVFTPWIIRGLAFDPSHRLAAREMPGPLYGIFGMWFVVFLVCMGLWSIHAIRRLPEETSRSQKTWIVASMISATGTAVSYFLFVMNQISWHYYAPMVAVAVMCFCLTAALSHRMRRTAQPIDFRLGAIILVVPFAAGALLTYSLVARGLAAFLLAVFAPTIVKESEGSIQALVDRLFRDKFRYLVEIERLGEDIYRRTNLSELLRGLARDLAEKARMSWVGVWLIDITAGAFHLQRASGFASENDVPHHLWTTSFGPANPLIKRFEFDKSLLLSDETAQDEEQEAAQELARWSIAAALPMYSGDKFVGFIGFGPKLRQEAFHSADITTLSVLGRKAERAIAQAYMFYQQAKMLAKLSHDILNFINPQTLAIQELAQGCGPVSADQKKHLKTLWKQKDLIEESIRDLLELERLVELRMEGKWRMRGYHLGELAQASIAAYEAKAKGRGVILEAALSPCPDGIGDPRSIRRIIDNLVINALKFTPTGGRILVQVQPVGANLRLAVSDTGPGVPAEDLPRIFDPFYQGSNHPGLVQGTGIGLSNVKEFVSLHKGSLRVDSELEHGTTFVIELPSISRVQEFDAAMLDAETLLGKAA
jgi:signal transduction histidine kinase